MNVDDFLRHRGLLLATLGTGVIIGATSTILYHHIISKREKEKLHHGMQQLEIAIRDIRSELERLRFPNFPVLSGSEKEESTAPPTSKKPSISSEKPKLS